MILLTHKKLINFHKVHIQVAKTLLDKIERLKFLITNLNTYLNLYVYKKLKIKH